MDDIIFALGPRGRKFGAITVFPLWPKVGETAKRVLVKARKGVAAPLQVTSGLVLHADDGNYTETANAILGGEPLVL